MPTLLLAEHDSASLKDATNKALTAAKALGADVHVLVAGHNCRAVADAAAKLDGVKKAEDFGVDIAPRLKVLKTAEPPTRKSGVKVADVAELVRRL